VLFHQITVCE